MTRSTRPPEPARITLPRNPSSVAAARPVIAARAAAGWVPKPARDLLALVGSRAMLDTVPMAQTPPRFDPARTGHYPRFELVEEDPWKNEVSSRLL